MTRDTDVVYIKVEPSSKGFGKKLNDDITAAVGSVSKTGSITLVKAIGGAFESIGRVGSNVIGAIAAAMSDLISQGGFGRALDIENAAAKLSGLEFSAATARESIDGALVAVRGATAGLGDLAVLMSSLRISNVQGSLELAGAFNAIGDVSRSVENSVTELGGVFGAVASAGQLQLQTLAASLQQSIEVTSASVIGMFNGAIVSAHTALNQLNGTLNQVNGSGVASAFDSITDAVDKFDAAMGTFGKIKKFYQAGKDGMDNLVAMFNAVPGKLQSAFEGFGGAIARFAGHFSKSIRGVFVLEGNPFAGLLNAFVSEGGKLQSTVSNVLTSVRSAITSGLANLAFSWENSPLYVGFASMGQSELFTGLVNKISTGFTKVTGSIGGLVKPFGDAFGFVFSKLDIVVFGPLQSVLNSVGGVVSRFFAPGNFLKFFSVGGLFAGLVAGLGILNQSMGGSLTTMIQQISAQAPAIINQFVARFTSALPGIMQSGVLLLQSLLTGITTSLPSLMSGAAFIVSGLVNGLAQALPQIIPATAMMIMTLLTSIVEALPIIMTAGVQLLGGIIQGFVAAIPNIIVQIPVLIAALLEGLLTMLPLVLTAGVQIIEGIVNGLVSAIPMLVEQVPVLIATIVGVLSTQLPQIVQSGITVLVSLIEGIVNAIPILAAQIPLIIVNIVTSLIASLPQIISAGMQIIVALTGGLVQAIPHILAALPAIIKGIMDGFCSVDWGSVGKQIIDGIKNGITAFAGRLWDAAKGAAQGALDGVKHLLGIHSPSRVFRDEVGVMIGRGMALGIDNSAETVNRSMDALTRTLLVDGTTSVLASPSMTYTEAPNKASQVIEQNITITNHGVPDIYVGGTILGRTAAHVALQTLGR